MKRYSMSRKSKAEEFINQEYDITVTGRHVLVTDAMKDYAIEKVSKIDRFGLRIVEAIVTMDIQKFEHRVDIIVKVNDVKIKSSAATDDMYASIDKAVDKLQAQIRKYKTRLKDHHAKPLEVIDMRVNLVKSYAGEDEWDVNDQIEALNSDNSQSKMGEIVSQKSIPLKTLTPDEALMKIDLSGDNFLIFRNEIDRRINVIYKKNEEDNYGIVEVE